MITLFSSVSLTQTLALELMHRLSGDGRQSMACPKDCHRYCPWVDEAQRIDRWNREQNEDHEDFRLALYDFQRGVTMAINLADYFEACMQQLGDDEEISAELEHTAFCLSSWLRKLVQLLSLIAPRITCRFKDENLCA